MYLKKNTRHYKGATYHNYVLVESVATPKGPRQRTICSLGKLDPGPAEQWLELARKVEAAVAGQLSLTMAEPMVEQLAEQVRATRRRPAATSAAAAADELVTIRTDRVEVEEAREAGPVHVGHQLWRRLGLDGILRDAGLSARGCRLTEVMTLNRLVQPAAEYAMPGWLRRTALADLLEGDVDVVSDDTLYRHLDRLHPRREAIERALAEHERTLFNLDDTIYLYDLTSTYFEGECVGNPQGKRGYSRDQRPDCLQVVVGLVLGADGFPRAHEVFDGNRQDRETVDDMLTALEKRVGRRAGATVIVDRGMAFPENLAQITARGYHYIVASRQAERAAWLSELEAEEGWTELVRQPSPRNPAQKKSRVRVKFARQEGECLALCYSEGRVEKDRAIRAKHEARLLADLAKLQQRVTTGKLQAAAKVHEAIGRLKERYPRVARYYRIEYTPEPRALAWTEDTARKAIAAKLDGTSILKTDRTDLTAEQIWRLYILLTRVEDAFRDMKSPLAERPIFHQLQRRVQTHIFLCVLAYHLLVAAENAFLAHGVHTSWTTLRETLSTHQVVTVVLYAVNGDVLKIRRDTTAEAEHREIYRVLAIPQTVCRPKKTWQRAASIVTKEIITR